MSAEQLNLTLEYARARGVDIELAKDELEETLAMSTQIRDGRPWTPPWAKLGDTYGPEDEPWRGSYWIRAREATPEQLHELLGSEINHAQEVQKPRTQEGSKKHGSAGGDKEGRTPSIGAAADPRHLSPVPNQPTTEQLAELERVREDYKHLTKPTEWRLNEHGEVVDRSGVPPFREELEEAACTVPDELAGMMPEDSDLEPDPDGPEYGA
ncbi:hypothetical protein [Rhodococcus jostii]|uniref:hypothetical protein n=1 Tax=Rhodococcus jostii TaxID=132919 RepID=UPI00362D6E98